MIEQAIITYCDEELSRSVEVYIPLVDVLDSLDVLEVIVWIERNYQINIDPGDILPDNFGTVHQIASYIRSKTADGHNFTSKLANP